MRESRVGGDARGEGVRLGGKTSVGGGARREGTIKSTLALINTFFILWKC